MPVALLDLIVLGIVLISALLAAVRGFTREVLAIASWAVAAVAALVLHPYALPYVREHISNANIALAVAIAAIFLVTLVVVSFITVRLSDIVLDSRIGALDRTLGFLFGAARGLLICIVGFMFFNWLVPEKMQPEWARNARARPFLQASGDRLMAMLPDDPESTILQKLKRPKTDGEPSEPPAEAEPRAPGTSPATPGQRSDNGTRPGYNQADRRGLEQLVGGTARGHVQGAATQR
ncbi:CvpA family protein [Chelatococcus sp. SYSU_G07232]|uniref:CvpA family protein n=1 Tax=Chelatococcus albus TaxID=3047466 RepID=A0ABT7ADU6_9HYPH|nr:CvpA family protein [Chelatococcus sp. SYSU_G07232]MDJ1156969.1 CvpA family protein [Chelatococcus sp. SYSU_G07232]